MPGFNQRTDWVNLPLRTTPVFAADMLRVEAGIANIDCTVLPVDLMTTGPISQTGTSQVADGVTATAGMRVFDKDNPSSSARGVWIVQSGNWTRAPDLPAGAVLKSGSTVMVRGGSTQLGTVWHIRDGGGAATATIGSSGLTVQPAGKVILVNGTPSARPRVNITGSGVTATDNSTNNRTDITITGSGGSSLAIENQGGSALPTQPTLNFTGAGVTASNNSGASRIDVTIPGGSGGVNWQIDAASGNGVQRLDHGFVNLLNNSDFGTWSAGTSAIPDGFSVNGGATVLRANSNTILGGWGARVTFTNQWDEFLQLYRVPTAGNWYTFTAMISNVSGSGTLLMRLVQDGFPFNILSQVDLSPGSFASPKLVMITGQWPTSLNPAASIRVAFAQDTTTAAGTWQIDWMMLQDGQGIATNFNRGAVDLSSTQTVGGIKTFTSVPLYPPAAYTTLTPSISGNYVRLVPSNYINFYNCSLSSSGGNVLFGAEPPNVLNSSGNFNGFSYSAGAKIFLCIQQDSTGGRIWEISPSTIVWEGGPLYTYGPWAELPWDYTANTITFIELTWMGDGIGWLGRYTTGIPIQFSTTAATFSWTTTNGVQGWPAFLGQTAVNTQQLGFPVVFTRYTNQNFKNMAYNTLLQISSQTIRQQVGNNNYQYEPGLRWCEDGPRSQYGVGTAGNSGGYATGPGGAPALGLANINWSTINGPNHFPSNATVMVQQSDWGAMVHEFCHAISSQYYGGNNPMPGSGVGNGNEPALISTHSTLVALKTDCINNGDPANAPNPGDEWFAELERFRRYGDNGSIVDNPTTANSAQNQVGKFTNAGPGGTGGTPTQRYNRFVTYVTSLYGSN